MSHKKAKAARRMLREFGLPPLYNHYVYDEHKRVKLVRQVTGKGEVVMLPVKVVMVTRRWHGLSGRAYIRKYARGKV